MTGWVDQDQVTAVEGTAETGGPRTVSVIRRSMEELHAERTLRQEAEARATLAEEWRDHYERRWQGAERRVARAMRANRALWDSIRLWQAWARSGWGVALVAGFVAVVLALTLFKTFGG